MRTTSDNKCSFASLLLWSLFLAYLQAHWCPIFAVLSIHEQPFQVPHYHRIDDLPSVASATQTTWWMVEKFPVERLQPFVSNVRCVRLHCHAEGTHPATDRLFGPLNKHLGDCRFYSNAKMQLAVREFLRGLKSLICTAEEFLNSTKIGRAVVCSGIVFKIIILRGISELNVYNVVITTFLNFAT